MIIDAHCHAGTGDGLTSSYGKPLPLDRYLNLAVDAGIDQTVIFSAFQPNYSAANRQIAKIMDKCPGRFLGFAFVHPERDKGRIFSMIEEAVFRYGFCGIKVHRHDGRISREICEAARMFSLPVLYDLMGETSVIDLLASEYSDVNFIIPHLGSFGDDWKAQSAIIGHLARYPNIYTDTSGVRRFDMLEEAVRKAGPHKILFGSDGPWLHPGLELAKVRALRLPKPEEGLILGQNFLRLTEKARNRRNNLNIRHRCVLTLGGSEAPCRSPRASLQPSAGSLLRR